MAGFKASRDDDLHHRAAALSLVRCVPLFVFLLLFPSSLLLLRSELAEADRYLGAGGYLNCMRNATSLTTTFTSNLNTALRNLTSHSSQGTKYATTTVGSGASMVYAMFQCRGDQSLELCEECMQNATVRLQQRDCPRSLGARIQLDGGCYLRYDNQSFFEPDRKSELDRKFVIGYCDAQTSDPVALAAIENLVANVTTLAPKQGGFASANAGGEYAAAQCLGYLSQAQCSDCLSSFNYSFMCDSMLSQQVYLTSCYYRFEPRSFLASLPPPSSPSPSPAPASPSPSLALPPPKASSGSKTARIAVGVVVGVVILTAALCAILVWRHKAKRVKEGERVQEEEELVEKAESWPRQLCQTKAQLFSLEQLQEATGNFHPTTKLGEGGFGVVYKGTLMGGEQVAIKRLSVGREEGIQEFLNEVNLITSVQHKNLIRLLGCCVEGPEKILVYEYLPNRSLDFFLFGESRTLDWSTRYGIILGMAKGLTYLHEESHIRIIHRDIKPSNILLDDQLHAVIADFGLARLVKENATHVNTRVAGTIGYVAPEYAICGDLSEKVDVFSFGLVSLEILTGTRNLNGSLLTRVWENYQQGRVVDLVDEKLGSGFSPEQAVRVVHVALLCTQENPKQRPGMSMVTLWLSGSSAILDIPTRPTFLNYMAPMGDVNHQITSGEQVAWFSKQSQSWGESIDPR